VGRLLPRLKSWSGPKGRAPKGLEDSAQGFNPGNRRPERFALKERQIERTNNAKERSNCSTSQLRALIFGAAIAASFIRSASRPFRANSLILTVPRVETLGYAILATSGHGLVISQLQGPPYLLWASLRQDSQSLLDCLPFRATLFSVLYSLRRVHVVHPLRRSLCSKPE
jgi:hypothetical protein